MKRTETRTIKAVVFDMDGVLVDARDWHYEALNYALEPFGMEISRSDHENRFNGMTTRAKLALLTQERNLPVELHGLISRVKQDRTLRIAAARCFPNVHHLILINRLKSLGIKIGVYTNSVRETSEYMLRHSEILPLLDCLITNEDVPRSKPAPDGYLKICERLGHDPSETLVIEDGDYGVQAAESAGCVVVRVAEPKDVNIEAIGPFVEGLL